MATYLEDVVQALAKLGGKATLSDIYAEVTWTRGRTSLTRNEAGVHTAPSTLLVFPRVSHRRMTTATLRRVLRAGVRDVRR